MVYGIGHFDQFSLPRGTYAVVREDRREGEGVKGSILKRGPWGTSGSYGDPKDRPLLESLGVWWPVEDEEKVA